MKGFTFPEEIFVQQSVDLTNELDAYRDMKGLEEDDTVAVYKLQKVCRVKVETKIVLVPENEIGSYCGVTERMDK